MSGFSVSEHIVYKQCFQVLAVQGQTKISLTHLSIPHLSISLIYSRSIFIATVEDQKRVGFSEEVFLVQFVATKLHHYRLLRETNTLISIVAHTTGQKTASSSQKTLSEHFTPLKG